MCKMTAKRRRYSCSTMPGVGWTVPCLKQLSSQCEAVCKCYLPGITLRAGDIRDNHSGDVNI